MASMPIPSRDGDAQYAPGMRLELSLKGQLVQSYSFDKDAVVVGRDPYCEVFVDNPGVSRQHFQIRRGETGEFQVMDMGSSNGTYLNDRPVKVATLRDGDTIQFAKYSLQIGLDELVGGSDGVKPVSTAEGATIMLSPSEVRQMVADARQPSPARPAPQSGPRLVPPPTVAPEPVAQSQGMSWTTIVLAAVLGVATAAVVAWFLFTR